MQCRRCRLLYRSFFVFQQHIQAFDPTRDPRSIAWIYRGLAARDKDGGCGLDDMSELWLLSNHLV